MGMYIPNMKSEQFYDLCKEHGLEIIAVHVPTHGDLIDRDTVKKLMYTMLDSAPTIIPAEEE